MSYCLQREHNPGPRHLGGCATAAYECREPKQNNPASQSSINRSEHVVKVFMVTLHVVRHFGKTVFVNIQVLGQHALGVKLLI